MAPDGRERVRVTSPVSPASSATAGGSSLGAAAARVRVRPVTEDELACLGQQVEESLRAEGWAEVPAHEVGLAILGPLRDLDQVAYLRFASVYSSFESLEDFEDEIRRLRSAHLAASGSTVPDPVPDEVGPTARTPRVDPALAAAVVT